jgi:hypothetical protein
MTTRCNGCGRNRKLRPYTVSAGPTTAALSLCSECARPIVDLLSLGDTNAPDRGKEVRRDRMMPPTHAVIPVD